MSKRQFKAHASSGRVGGGLGPFSSAGFGSTPSSILSYIQEPPDYSLIGDAHLAIAFKNLSKKDATTKAKALEDLQTTLFTTDGEIEDAIVETWVKIYPRLSIDNARRVRQLCHTFNGQLCAKCGKRIAKHLPRIVGPWLAGLFDIDRTAAKAAQDALKTVFPSPEKITGLQKTFQESILEYCKAALLDETVKTLSDERSVSAEDAESTYARVLSSSIAVLTSLLDTLSSDDVSKEQHLYDTIMSEGKVWEFSSHPDASVRRATHRLVQTCTRKYPTLLRDNLKVVSKAYIYKGLASEQTGSAVDFALALEALTLLVPTIWTEAYSGKKSAILRLQQCLKRGSHSSTTAFWDATRTVLQNLPSEVIPKFYDEIADLLLAARDGISRKEERFNASSAWPTYFTLVNLVTLQLSEDDAERVIEAFAMPPVNQFVHPGEDSAKWTISGAKAANLVSKVAMVKRLPGLLLKKWPHLSEKLIEAARMSQPEQSKDFDKSQKHVATMAERWASLQREFYADEYQLPESVISTFTTTSTKILKECIALLEARNGKPYGAAAVIEEQLRACGPQLLRNEDYGLTLIEFGLKHVPTLMFSRSQSHLARCLGSIGAEADIRSALEASLRYILEASESDQSKAEALHALFPRSSSQVAVEVARTSELLQSYLKMQAATSTNPIQAALFADLFKLGAVSEETTDVVLLKATNSLYLSGSELETGMETFERLASTNQPALKLFMSSDAGKGLLPAVLKLEQHTDETVADKAAALSARLTSAMGDAATDAKYGLVLQNLESASRDSLAMDSLLDLTGKIGGDQQDAVDPRDLLPNLELWRESILVVMAPPKPSLSLLSPLGGALHLTHGDTTNATITVQYDAEGLSQALRIAMYVARLLSRPGMVEKLDNEALKVFALLNICVLLAEDNTSIHGVNGLWLTADSTSVEFTVMDFVSEANISLNRLWERGTTLSAHDVDAQIFTVFDTLGAQQARASPMAYYIALATCKACENIFEVHGYSSEQARASEVRLKDLQAKKDTLSLTSFIAGAGQPLTGSQTLTRMCNELIAELTDLSMEHEQASGLERLVILNAILNTQEDILSSVQKTRLIFFIKRIVPWLENDTLPATKAEACKTLTALLPHISDMYGEHWSQIVELLANFWNSPASLSDDNEVSEVGVMLVHASLKLYSALYRLSKAEEPNDDLLEALQENRGQLHNGMIGLLKSSGEISDETHQPLMITNELLARELARSPFKPLSDVEELFPLLYTPSQAVQGAAFDLLHKQIPAAQEQISFDAALDDKSAHLPDELLSLIIDAPTLETLADASFERSMPLPLQGFLYSWRVLLDHFTGSSYRVKSDYIEQLKEGGYLSGLLSLIFDFLGHSRGRPIDASRFELQDYAAGTEPNPERDTQWLLSHLYYLALFHLPSLIKSYFLDIRSRQTSQAIESWTAKYVSPLIISANLQSVSDWAGKSVKDDPDYENMTVKVGMRSKEINVSYVVDEQTMAIKVVLPEAYPLDSAKVVSVSRVAVKEEKWQSWLRNCQGVITFSNGSITDGLSAWRKNVIGALKGQTECAICYSIISGDKQLPTKRCPTCKNLFHSSCLLKWFKTSNASTCPLCRNPFNFN